MLPLHLLRRQVPESIRPLLDLGKDSLRLCMITLTASSSCQPYSRPTALPPRRR
jgi:hypothetical protein